MGKPNRKIGDFFLDKRNPYSRRRTINKARVKTTIFIGLGLLVVALLFVGSGGPKETESAELVKQASVQGTRHEEQAGKSQVDYAEGTDYLKGGSSRASSSTRQYSASQVVKRGGDSSGTEERLPAGTGFAVRLVNRVVSADGNSPVIAELETEASFEGSPVIPQGARVLGQATFDEGTKRLQIRFHLTVFPDGSEHPISALALQGDGSSGLSGSYSSGRTSQQFGRSLGRFAAGLTQGLKDRTASGWGRAYEPGSLKNGLLNGVAEAATEQAEQEAEDMKNTRPSIEVPAGTAFLVYLEREFKP